MFRWFAVWLAVTTPAFAQDFVSRSSITLSTGGETSLGSAFARTGPAFNGQYEFRVSKYFALDAGQETWLPAGFSPEIAPVFPIPFRPGPPIGYTVVGVPTRYLSTAFHATGRGILPLAHDRLELFLGVGGGYAWNLGGSPLPSGFVLAFEAGGRFAVDKHHRFWIGASSQFFGNFSSNRQQWFATTADFGFRFGAR